MADEVRTVSLRITGKNDSGQMFQQIGTQLEYLKTKGKAGEEQLQALERQLSRLQAEAKKGLPKTFGDRLDDAKQTFGRRGMFGDIGELLVGGGALGGVSYLANNLAKGIDGISAAVQGLQNGTKTANDVLGEVIRSVPVVGGLFRSVGDALLAQMGTIRKELRDIDTEAHKITMRRLEEIRTLEREAGGGRRNLELVGLTGFDRESKQLEHERDAALERFREIEAKAAAQPGGLGADARVQAVEGQIAAVKEFERKRAELVKAEREKAAIETTKMEEEIAKDAWEQIERNRRELREQGAREMQQADYEDELTKLQQTAAGQLRRPSGLFSMESAGFMTGGGAQSPQAETNKKIEESNRLLKQIAESVKPKPSGNVPVFAF